MKSDTWLLYGLKIGRVYGALTTKKNRDSELWLPSELPVVSACNLLK